MNIKTFFGFSPNNFNVYYRLAFCKINLKWFEIVTLFSQGSVLLASFQFSVNAANNADLKGLRSLNEIASRESSASANKTSMDANKI